MIGKFENPEALLAAYQSLEKEFTRRSQRLRELEKKQEKSNDGKSYFEILGYDSNFDLGGSHTQPRLAIVHGTESQALAYAETIPGYRGGQYIVGDVRKYKMPNIIELED